MLKSAVHHFCLMVFVILAMAAATARADTSGLGVIAVGHPVSTDIWIGTSRTADQAFEGEVLQRCRNIMGTGCSVINRASSGVLVIAKNEAGIIWTMGGRNAEEARRNLLPPCQQPYLECDVVRVIPVRDPGPKARFDDPRDSRNIRGLAAAIIWHAVDAPGQLRSWRLWVATGRSTTDLAVADATANCRAAVGGGCYLLAAGISTHLVAFTDSSGRLFAKQGQTLAEARSRMERHCRQNGEPCKIHFTANAAMDANAQYSISP